MTHHRKDWERNIDRILEALRNFAGEYIRENGYDINDYDIADTCTDAADKIEEMQGEIFRLLEEAKEPK